MEGRLLYGSSLISTLTITLMEGLRDVGFQPRCCPSLSFDITTLEEKTRPQERAAFLTKTEHNLHNRKNIFHWKGVFGNSGSA